MQREFQSPKTDLDQEKIKGKKIAIVVSRFNDDITGAMLKGAKEFLIEQNISEDNIDVFWVPGAFEIPIACQRLSLQKNYDGLIALGCVIKGESDHYYYICCEVSRGIMDVMLRHNVPIAFGILTVTSLEQAKERSSGKGNKGVESASALLSMISNF